MQVRIGLVAAMIVMLAAKLHAGGPSAGAVEAFNRYIGQVESRLAVEHRPEGAGAGCGAEALKQARQGQMAIEKISVRDGGDLDGAMLHHWRGTAFAPGAKADDFARLMQDFGGYARLYAPQVLSSRTLGRQDDRFQMTMRVRQKHVLTVVMDTSYEVLFGRTDARRGYSLTHSTRIAEIENAGTGSEHALNESDGHGFLWRQYSYWSYVERDGGLYIELESVSLTRAIPPRLGWAVGPFVESVPRESLEFTLQATREALRK